MMPLKTFVFVLISLYLSGCATVLVPKVSRHVSSISPILAWEKVLAQNVDSKGRVDFQKLQEDHALLDRYVEYVAHYGPETHPEEFSTPDSRLAHYLNAYNALSMYNVLDSGIPVTNAGLRKVKFFLLKKFKIDGSQMSLYSYENDIIRKQGDERVHFALNCMARSCPVLPQVPFRADNLRAELQKQAIQFFSEERNIRVDISTKTVHVSQILEFFTGDFLVKEKSLIGYINRFRKDQIPGDYQVQFIPYDWTINGQHAPSEKPKSKEWVIPFV